jgi:hypothetical protein
MGTPIIDLPQCSALRYLSTTTELALAHLCEEGYLIQSASKEAIYLGWFYGDPTCSIIDKNNKWAIMAGTNRFVLWQSGTLHELSFANAHEMRQHNDETLHILTDPWSTDSAIWEFNVTNQQFNKIRDFKDYIDQEFTEEVNW